MSKTYDTPSLWGPAVKNPKPHNSLQVSKHGRGSYTSTILDWRAGSGRGSLVNADFVSMVTNGTGSGMVAAQNQALSKVYDQLGQAEDLLVAWKERQKAIDQVVGYTRNLINIARAVKRRDPRIVRAVLKRNPNAKDLVRTPSGLWLGYHFGIVPTVHDIHSALSIFSNALPQPKISASSGAPGSYSSWDNEGFDWWCTAQCKIGGVITNVDPNVNLATRLGFGQPLSVAWEMTPFSWFVDYFVNVGDLVKNLEPRFPAIRVEGQYTTRRVQYTAFYRVKSWNKNLEMVQGRWYARTHGWPGYQLQFKSPLDLNGQQCSYIVSVLGQLLTGMKHR